ncbi:5-hydroxytryptamine receptor 3A-like [Pagrus major]|uniref:5-hydroxytryptamine receptor 3A-like n=1 Tax=Pagrus major TaxID=143350 RepID=UPI003CC8B09B
MSAPRILVFVALIGVSSGQTSDCSYSSLLQHFNLTTSNELLSIMRPVKNWTTSSVVLMDMYMYGILQVDMKFQTVTSHIWVLMGWRNEFLTWNSSDFCGIDELTVPTSRLWIPDINIQEDASDSGSTQRGALASVSPDGWVMVSARQRLTATCQLKLRLFPFDTQLCSITFASMISDDESIKLGTFNNDTTLTQLSESFMITQGEWQLEKMDTYVFNISVGQKTQSKLVYRVKIIRKPLLYVINFIVPLFYLLILDLASFFISEGSGEKMSFKVTILLSISVLLLILKDMLPSTEDQLPMIASYSVAIFALVGISVLEAMLISFLFELDDYCVKKEKRCVDAKEEIQLETDCHRESAGSVENGQVKPERSCLPLDGPSGRDLLKRILMEVKAARREMEGQETEKTKTGFYKRVAQIIDSVFFFFYFFTVTTFLTFMYFEWIQNGL